jgi:hypothetical protein
MAGRKPRPDLLDELMPAPAAAGRPHRSCRATANPPPPSPATSKTPPRSTSSVTGPSSTKARTSRRDRPPGPPVGGSAVADSSTVVSVSRACYESRCSD